MPPNYGIQKYNFNMTSSDQSRELLEGSTQTEESGTMTSFSDYEIGGETQILDHNLDENEGVIERLARLFSTTRQHRGTQTAKDPMACETEKLAFDIIYYNLGKRPASQNDDDVVRCLRQCVSQMLENHSIIFNRIISRIDLDQNTDFQKGFYVVSEELFQGQVLTWGRIVSLFAYGARLAQHCVENDMSNMVIDVVSSLSHVAVDKLTPFLKDHGGWAMLCEAFPMQHDYEGKIWRSLVITGMGLTAIATLLALQRSS